MYSFFNEVIKDTSFSGNQHTGSLLKTFSVNVLSFLVLFAPLMAAVYEGNKKETQSGGIPEVFLDT